MSLPGSGELRAAMGVAGRWMREQLGAHALEDTFIESNERRWRACSIATAGVTGCDPHSSGNRRMGCPEYRPEPLLKPLL